MPGKHGMKCVEGASKISIDTQAKLEIMFIRVIITYLT